MLKYINLEYHGKASQIKMVDKDICQTLCAAMGTGGGNVPIVLVYENDCDSKKVFERDSDRYRDKSNA